MRRAGSNGDGVPSAGDTVTLGRYPLGFENPMFGTFQDPGPFTIDGTYGKPPTSTSITVRSSLDIFTFGTDGGDAVAGLIDKFGAPYWLFAESASTDTLAALNGAPGLPSVHTPMVQRPADGADHGFVDVDIHNPLP